MTQYRDWMSKIRRLLFRSRQVRPQRLGCSQAQPDQVIVLGLILPLISAVQSDFVMVARKARKAVYGVRYCFILCQVLIPDFYHM